jgi:hypothetical protein
MRQGVIIQGPMIEIPEETVIAAVRKYVEEATGTSATTVRFKNSGTDHPMVVELDPGEELYKKAERL